MSVFWLALVKKINGTMQQMSNCYTLLFDALSRQQNCELSKNRACMWPEFTMKASFAMKAKNSDIQKRVIDMRFIRR